MSLVLYSKMTIVYSILIEQITLDAFNNPIICPGLWITTISITVWIRPPSDIIYSLPSLKITSSSYKPITSLFNYNPITVPIWVENNLKFRRFIRITNIKRIPFVTLPSSRDISSVCYVLFISEIVKFHFKLF